MPIESLPTFTKPARKLWDSISAEARENVHSNVWCGHCRRDVSIVNYIGRITLGNLLLLGQCSECSGDISRLVEFIEREDGNYVLLGKPKVTEAEQMRELALMGQEQKAFMKQMRALQRKSTAGSITRKEEVELNRLSNKGLGDLAAKLLSFSERGVYQAK